ncbi:MAG: DUF294 nucleotidyltransferase-like domain-containing protein, partial [Burkholderiales bacterium]
PILLDELLNPRLLVTNPGRAALDQELTERLGQTGDDVEMQLDTLRHFKHARTLHLIAQDVAGLLPLETLSDYLSELADCILEATLQLCWKQLHGTHRAKARFAVIGYGKLGGKELGYASDLDLIFLYDDPAPQAGEMYARLAQRLNAWLTRYTAAGVLYETDLRLRPDGASGLLVSSLQAFEEYQTHHAWTWEHQALSRARWVAGDTRIAKAFERIRSAVLCRVRDPAKLRSEIVAMRENMRAAHPNPDPLFDIKHDAGGIVDVEFIVQYLVLAHAYAHRGLTANIGNLALLKLAGELGLIPAKAALDAHAAYRELRRGQHRLRLEGAPFARVEHRIMDRHIRAVARLWKRVFTG